MKGKFILKLWNRKYGKSAEFIVQNTETKQYTLFSLSAPKDVTWVKEDLTKDPSYKSWDNFHDEPVDDLGQIIM